ncbi:hypothetical protein LOZ15_005230 [Ophidiomyces ophidiicola]|nr:hypothetical protein LOZ15_005230 [Ophidiomyces ophidiicola]
MVPHSEKIKLDIDYCDPQGDTLLRSTYQSKLGVDILMASGMSAHQNIIPRMPTENSTLFTIPLIHYNDDAANYTLAHLHQLAKQPDHHSAFPPHANPQVALSPRRTS